MDEELGRQVLELNHIVEMQTVKVGEEMCST
jgi:hypothetical protein